MYCNMVIDAHCDTISEMYHKLNLRTSEGQIDIERMKQYRGWIQFFSVWIADSYKSDESIIKRAESIIDNFKLQLAQKSSDMVLVTNYDEAQKALLLDKIGAVLTLEGAGPIGNDLSKIDEYYQKGVRLITLTWNDTNFVGSGVGDTTAKTGITDFGREAVQRMNELGIIIDLSHAHEKTFWDVCGISQKPVIASHSNSQTVCNHQRNLTDEQFREIIRLNGVAGLNFYPPFVKGKNACIDDLLVHVDKFIELGGENNIALGSDFDGIDYGLDDLNGAEDMHILFEKMSAHGYSDDLIEKISYKNMLRVMGDILCC